VDVITPVPLPLSDVVRISFLAKVAVTERDCDIETVHAPAPAHAPVHPVKTESFAGVAVNAIEVPVPYGSAQSLGQLIPTGLELTVPDPFPAVATVKTGFFAIVALTACDPFIVTEHVPIPVQAPDQPLNSESGTGVTASVTTVPVK
jgi:hypothetical protein